MPISSNSAHAALAASTAPALGSVGSGDSHVHRSPCSKCCLSSNLVVLIASDCGADLGGTSSGGLGRRGNPRRVRCGGDGLQARDCEPERRWVYTSPTAQANLGQTVEEHTRRTRSTATFLP